MHLSYFQVTEVTVAARRDNTNVTVTIRLTNELPPNDPISIHVKNLLFNKSYQLMEFVQIAQNWYNSKEPYHLSRHR